MLLLFRRFFHSLAPLLGLYLFFLLNLRKCRLIRFAFAVQTENALKLDFHFQGKHFSHNFPDLLFTVGGSDKVIATVSQGDGQHPILPLGLGIVKKAIDHDSPLPQFFHNQRQAMGPEAFFRINGMYLYLVDSQRFLQRLFHTTKNPPVHKLLEPAHNFQRPFAVIHVQVQNLCIFRQVLNFIFDDCAK